MIDRDYTETEVNESLRELCKERGRKIDELEAKLEGVNILIKDWEDDAEYDNELEDVIRNLRKAIS